MRKYDTEILVIGGGATGTGVVRDLAMRGFRTILVEKRDLTHGTSGRYHGLLHSGGRYVVKDPQAAKECIEENRILRRIMPFCIEDTGGFFILTPWDDPAYAARFEAACTDAGIPVEEITIKQMLREEPLLNPQITRCFRVPDASADSFLAADANAESARQYRAEILPYCQVMDLVVENGRVVGARGYDLAQDEEITISCDMVVNAAGAWAGQIADMAGSKVHIIPGKGTMIAVNHRVVNTVINRCKMPSDGDILVPAHTVAVIGTTDVPVENPDLFAIEPWEVQLMLTEGEKMIPGFKDMRMLRAWAGVRPLYREVEASMNRDLSRAFVLLDHEERDGVAGLVTITSGKWTTYRKMAEVTVNLVCAKLGVARECRTDQEILPEPAYAHPKLTSSSQVGRLHHHDLGTRLRAVEADRAYGALICECELATVEDVERAICEGQAQTIDDLRRDVRLGMGPCQGGFCTYRAAGMMHELGRMEVPAVNAALHDFLQERWKGLLPILWGQQLRQERLDEVIYLSVFNVDHLPGPKETALASTNYAEPSTPLPDGGERSQRSKPQPGPLSPTASAHPLDAIVVGAGLSGLTAAWQIAAAGKRVRVLTKGWGSNYWNAGCVDVLGYYPGRGEAPLDSPLAGLKQLIDDMPGHPYALAGIEGIAEALSAMAQLFTSLGYPLQGSLDRNWQLPSGIGAARPTCLAPETMVAGDMRRTDPVLIVGFESYRDFYPRLVADNLAAQGIPSVGITVQVPILAERNFVTTRELARAFEDPEIRAQIIQAVQDNWPAKAEVKPARIGFPAVLGMNSPLAILHELQENLGMPVFEIPTLPASAPGMRLSIGLISAIEQADGRVFEGMQAVDVQGENGKLANLLTESAARHKSNRAENYILATGGLLGGGLFAHQNGQVRETAAGLPVDAPQDRTLWLEREFASPGGHPIYRSGVPVNENFQPVDGHGSLIYSNLYAAGSLLAHADVVRERSLDGVAVVTGYLVGKTVGKT
jgi:glycerol-3-phosphate dehydrogenase